MGMGKGYPVYGPMGDPSYGPMSELQWIMMDPDPLSALMRFVASPITFLLLLLLFLYLLYMAVKSPSKFWENFGRNLKIFYLYIAAFVGLIMFIFSGVTTTKTFLETTIFPVEYEYIDLYMCENPRYDTPDGKARTLTPEEKVTCEEKVREQAKQSRKDSVNRDYAGGLAGILFGLILWVPHFLLARRVK